MVNSVNMQSSGALPPVRDNQLTQESFLKLLLTQLKQQDPSSPFDSSTMMQQISQLTGLSSSHELQKSIGQLSQSMGNSQVFEAAHMIGKEVQVLSNKSQLEEGKNFAASVLVPEQVKEITVEIRNDKDELIKTLKLNPPSGGTFDFEWNGLNEAGEKMPVGFYKMSATTMVDDKAINLPTAGTYKVNSVALDRTGKGVIINVAGLGGVFMNDVIKIL